MSQDLERALDGYLAASARTGDRRALGALGEPLDAAPVRLRLAPDGRCGWAWRRRCRTRGWKS